MALISGTRLGPYEITAPLGAGGMGEVYRARDMKLGRDVALKVLPDLFSAEAERMGRLRREAQVLASLSHTNIAAIYGFEDSGNTQALVMELVEGPTLQERIRQGALPLDEALRIAGQIAEALEYAHERGIVHRDLKPANVKLTPEGQVKLLDFGLAKALAGEAADQELSNSPTLTAAATRAGTLLGTAAYMSPEQARGKRVDRRADIWAFGCVLYEMLTCRSAFAAETTSDTLAGVIRGEPEWESLPRSVPARIRELVRRCLRKDPKQRLQAIGDARIAIQEALSGSGAGESASATSPTAEPYGRWLFVPTAVAVVIALAAGVAWWRASRPVLRPMMRFSAELVPMQGPYERRLGDTIIDHHQPGNVFAISPDGMRLAATVRDANGDLVVGVRRFDQNEFKPLPGTNDPAALFFSPDGQWIAFFGNGELKKVSVEGGAPVMLCKAGVFASGSWGDDGTIIASLFGNSAGEAVSSVLSRIPAEGGTPVAVTQLKEGETRHRFPQVLPGSRAVLFTAFKGPNGTDLEVLSFRNHEPKVLLHGGIAGHYVAAPDGTGYLIYLHDHSLFAVPFDAKKLTLTGTPQAVLDDMSSYSVSTPSEFDVSQNGTLLYLSGPGELEREIFWLDQKGKPTPLHPQLGFYEGLQFSPNGKRLLFGMGDKTRDLWVQDLERNTVERLTSLPGKSGVPLWSPDGSHILFGNDAGGQALYWIRSDGAGEPLKVSMEQIGSPTSFSPDGKWLAMFRGDPFTGVEVWIAPVEGTADHPQFGKPQLFTRVPGFPMPAFSPDGHWIAYSSSETGQGQIYVQPFPGPGGKVAISTGGGRFPRWASSGHELFFLSLDLRIMIAEYTERDGVFSASTPRVWSQQKILSLPGGGPFQFYAVTPDGKRFAVMLYPDGTAEHVKTLNLTFLLNFGDELSRRFSAR